MQKLLSPRGRESDELILVISDFGTRERAKLLLLCAKVGEQIPMAARWGQ
jgi:hypothetical protein